VQYFAKMCLRHRSNYHHRRKKHQRKASRPTGRSIQSHLIGDRPVAGEQLSSSRVSVALAGSKLGSVWTRSGRLNPFQVLTHKLPREGVLGEKPRARGDDRRKESEDRGDRPRGLDQLQSALVWTTIIQPTGPEARSHEEKGEAFSDAGGPTVITCPPLGSAHGCLRQWQDLYAVPHIVRPFPVMRSPRNHQDQHALSSQLK
jgi:hypothetical protein